MLLATLISIQTLTCVIDDVYIECKDVEIETSHEVDYEKMFAIQGQRYLDALACAQLGYGNPESPDYPGSGYHDAKEAPENEAMREQQRKENEEG